MITTEEEAKTKLCHEAIGPGVTGWAFVPIERRCVASECMAWRWQGWRMPNGRTYRNDMHPNLPPATGEDGTPERAGYCGKATCP